MIVLSALIALVACNKVETEQPTAKEYTYDITITRADDTKAVKADWENGDVVYVFFSNVDAPKYLKFTYDGSAWTRTQYNGATAESFTYPGDGDMTAIYLPYGNDAVVSADEGSFKFDKTYTSYYLKAEKAPYTVSGTVVSGTLSMEAPEGFVQFAMPMSGEVNSTATTFFRTTNHLDSHITYTLSDNNLKPVSFASVTADGSITVTEGTEGDPITGYIYGGDINFSGVLKSTSNGSAADYAFTFVNNNGTAATYDDVTYLLSGNKTLSYKAAIKFPAISSSAWKVPAPEYVEIKGVKWAKWNIGASAVGGYGDYFAWGATYPQARYGYEDYRESSISANLAPANDVASQKLGSEWHMPTENEIRSIFYTSTPGNPSGQHPATGVTWNWISDTDTYGTWGYEVYVSKDKKIFLPTAGRRLEDILNFEWSGGFCWSSKFDFTQSAYHLNLSGPGWGIESTYHGLSVRPVHN